MPTNVRRLIVVVTITYLSLVIGELVPKSLALIYRERMASLVAVPIHWLSKVARPVVTILTFSTRIVLFFLGRKKISKEMFASEEEIRFLIKEGASQGIFDQTEQQMIPKVFEFSELRIRDVMIPRGQITSIDAHSPRRQSDQRNPSSAGEACKSLRRFEADPFSCLL